MTVPRRSAAAAALVLVTAGLAPGCKSIPRAADEQRTKDTEWLTTASADANASASAVANTAANVAARSPRTWLAVQGGYAIATGPTADDAVRAANRAAPLPFHRFVFRKDDAGDRLHRLAFLPAGGLVAGRKALADLGLRVVGGSATGSGRPIVLERHGSRRTLDLAKTPRLRFDITPLGGTTAVALALDVTIDPDFDGPLLLPADIAKDLDLALAEIPGHAEIQVALGRPFEGRRAWVAVKCNALDASGAVETIVPDAPPARK
ncbi:MAG: hypothetical protein K8T90_20100 [Planctomycetes bacterium]|nr:hypothetical protein [Planctomycetota bacterium]